MRHLCLGYLGPRYSDINTVVSSQVHGGWEVSITMHLGEHALSWSLYISTYINTKMFVCLLPFFSAISKPTRKPFGMKLVFDPEKKLKQ